MSWSKHDIDYAMVTMVTGLTPWYMVLWLWACMVRLHLNGFLYVQPFQAHVKFLSYLYNSAFLIAVYSLFFVKHFRPLWIYFSRTYPGVFQNKFYFFSGQMLYMAVYQKEYILPNRAK